MDKKKLDGFKKRLETRQHELRRMVSRTAQDGREALSYLQHQKGATMPCVILLDLMMPVMDGGAFRGHLLEVPIASLLRGRHASGIGRAQLQARKYAIDTTVDGFAVLVDERGARLRDPLRTA